MEKAEAIMTRWDLHIALVLQPTPIALKSAHRQQEPQIHNVAIKRRAMGRKAVNCWIVKGFEKFFVGCFALLMEILF
jgi:hypothetical protein